MQTMAEPEKLACLNLYPINDFCLDCHMQIDPQRGRQELTFDEQGKCRRRCGNCIRKQGRQ